jgi:hypothetical protein
MSLTKCDHWMTQAMYSSPEYLLKILVACRSLSHSCSFHFVRGHVIKSTPVKSTHRQFPTHISAPFLKILHSPKFTKSELILLSLIFHTSSDVYTFLQCVCVCRCLKFISSSFFIRNTKSKIHCIITVLIINKNILRKSKFI